MNLRDALVRSDTEMNSEGRKNMPQIFQDKNDAVWLASAIEARNEAAGWRKIRDDIEEWTMGAGYFRNGFDRDSYAHLEGETGIRTLNRQPSAASFIRLHRMAEGGALADVDLGDQAETAEAARKAEEFLQLHSSGDSQGGLPEKEDIGEIGSMFFCAGRKLMEEEIPALNWDDPNDVVRGFRHIQMLKTLSVDYYQLTESLSGEKEFAAPFGGRGSMLQMEDRLHLMSQYGRCVGDAVNPSLTEARRAAAKMAIEQYSHLFSGKTLADLPADPMLSQEMEAYLSVAEMWYTQAPIGDKNSINMYLGGMGEKPADLFGQVLRMTHENLMDIARPAEDSSLRTAEEGEFRRLRLFRDEPEKPAMYYELRRQSGHLAPAAGDTADDRQKKQEMTEEGDFCFRATCRSMGLDVTHPMYAEAGYGKAEELFFIDGIPAKEYVEKLYPGQNLTATETSRKLLRAEIVSAVLSGEHHVEAAKLGISRDGAYNICVTEVRLDDTIMDGQERFYQTKPSRKAEKFYGSDKTRRQRQDEIRGKVSQRFAAAASKKINDAEYAKQPHAIAAAEFSLDDPDMTDRYFNRESLVKLNRVSRGPGEKDGFGPEFSGDHYSGFRAMAQMVLLAGHPEIRAADLADPDKYAREKQEAGRFVADAAAKFYAGPSRDDPDDREYMKQLAETMHACMTVIAGMDVRRELMYALGEPENLEGDGAKAAMEKPENVLRVGSFLGSLLDLCV